MKYIAVKFSGNDPLRELDDSMMYKGNGYEAMPRVVRERVAIGVFIRPAYRGWVQVCDVGASDLIQWYYYNDKKDVRWCFTQKLSGPLYK